jgi:hypothetical protein
LLTHHAVCITPMTVHQGDESGRLDGLFTPANLDLTITTDRDGTGDVCAIHGLKHLDRSFVGLPLAPQVQRLRP